MSWLPGLDRLRHYERGWLRGDVVAGVTVAAYCIPQVMAYAEVAGVPPVAGLWAVIGAMLVYVLVGSSRQLSVGPESTTALMTAVAVAPLAAGDPARHAELAVTLALVVAVLCLVAWALRLGFLAELLSRPVLVGYLAGVAVIMVVSQLAKVTGVTVEGDGSPLAEAAAVLARLPDAHWPTVAVAVVALVLLFVGSRLFPRAPVPLGVILLASGVVALAGLRSHGIDVVGEVPAGVPAPALPDLDPAVLLALLVPALGVTVVGYTDNVVEGRAFASRSGDSIDANQELLVLGGANAAVSLLHGFPVSSSGSRTAIAFSLGARSQLSSLVAAASVLGVLFLGRGVLEAFPQAALGALVIWAATRLVDLPEFRRLVRFRLSEFVLALATTAGVLLLGILYGVLVAIALSLLDLLRRVARPHDGVLGYVPGLAGMHDVDDYPEAEQVPGLVVYRYDSPLFFANAEDFTRRALDAVRDADPPARWLLINAEANVQVDLTVVDALESLRADLERRGVVLALARVKWEVAEDLRRAGFLAAVGEEHVFATLPTAVEAYRRWAERESPPGN